MLCINYEVMTDPQEQENYLRMLFLVFDVGTSAKRSILANHLIKNSLNTLEDFIDKNQHDIYHYFDNRKCCLCMTDMSSIKTVLLPHQIQLIFDINRNPRKCGHRYGKNNKFCCLKAANISLTELDFTLLRFFIINFCDDVIWDDCLQSYNNNFETFLDKEKHNLYHMWKSNTACCLCRTGYVPPKQCIQSEQQYQLMFQFTQNSCNDDTCGYSVLPGLTYGKLKNDDKLLFINLTNAFCPLRKAIEILTTERNNLAHALQLRLDQASFESSWNNVTAAIERIASATNTLNDVRKNISDIKEQHFDVRLCLHKLEIMLRENQNMQDVSGAIENLVEDLKESDKRLSQLEETVQHNTEAVQQQITEAVQQNMEAVQQITGALQQNKEAIEKVYALLERLLIEGIVSNGNQIEITTQDPPPATTPSVMSAVWTSASNVIGWCLSTARKMLYKKDEDEDSFKCGKCGSKFNRIQDFLAHKDVCARRTKTKKYTSNSSNTYAAKDKYLKATVKGIGETWEKRTVEYSKENISGLNVDGAEVLYGELGSLTFWIKSSATSIASRSGLVSLVNSFLKNLFRTCPVQENKTIPVEVNVEIFQEISDVDEEGDIYHCGRCNNEYSSFTSFLRHKTDKCQTNQENSNPNKDVVPVSDSLAEHASFQCKKLLNMATQEQENFYRHSTVIVDETKDSFLHLLEFSLTNQGITLQRFIEINAHVIYHMFYNRYPCCQCPSYMRTSMSGSRVLQQQQLDMLFDPGGEKLPGHNPSSKSAPHCCSPINPNLQLQSLDFTLARLLLVSFTSIVPNGSVERNALDNLVKIRNESFAHAKEGRIPNDEYRKSMAEIENSLLVLAKIYGKEEETKHRLRDIAKQPLNTVICLQLQSTLLQIDEAIKQFFAEKKLPDCLTTDLRDVTVTEGCDAHFEIRTKECGMCSLWLQDGVEIARSEKFLVGTSGKIHSLDIRNSLLSDKGLYTVRIKDIERQAHLYVEEYFTKNMRSTYEYTEGDIVELSCAVLDDNVTAYWEKDGVGVQHGDRYKITDEGKNHKLAIQHINLQDAGDYCVKICDRMRSTSLNVKEYFTKPLGTMTCMEGETVQFECEVLDDQTALWFKDGFELSTSDKYKVETHERLHRLVVINTRLADMGEYSVKIQNCVRHSQLIVQEMPTAIKHLSNEDKELYINIIKTGTEIRNYIRIVILGENGVGKTCLLRRLLKQSITGVQSTDGIDMHRCKIKIKDGQWVFDEVSDKKKALLARIKTASQPITVEDETLQQKDDSLKGSGLQADDGSQNINREAVGTSRNISVRKRKTRQDKLEDGSVKRRKRKDQSFTTIPNASQDFEGEVESQSPQKHNNTVTKLLTDKVIQGLDDFLNGIEQVDVPADKFVECGILDFAGEKEYYATHPVFLNPNALHILVTNIMKDVKPITTEVGFDKIGEYIDFWLDTIHSCGVIEEIKEETKTEFLYPPAVIVYTRVDECGGHLMERKNEVRKQLLSVLKNEPKKKHLREICFVSNTESAEEDFNILRDTIFKYGKQLKTFAEKLPLKWIRLEQSLEVLREADLNILSWPDIVELSSKCSIDSEDEIKLFLKYQHKVGGVIYFESLKEYIILNQKWLANAFRCLVSDKFDSNLKLTDEWKALEDTGKLEHSLIVKLFDKEPELDFNKHCGHLLNVMEIFGIIVKLTTLMENGQRTILPTYYMPCMISEKASVTDIIDMFNANKDNCKRTPWLCIEFDFMPFDFFNHISCYYISQHAISTEPHTGRMAIYHGMGVFFLDRTKSVKFILCFCKNTIALQIWQWKNVEKGRCKTMLEELGGAIEKVKERFETRSVSYTVKSKCSDGNIHMPAGRHSYSELLDSGDDYFCEEHNDHHKTQDFYQTWFEDYTEKKDYVPAGIQDSRFKQKCHVCDKEPSVYWCHGCQRSMCQDCNNQHRKSTDTYHHIVQHVQDVYSLDYNFKVNVIDIYDIKVLHDDVLVIADWSGNQLVTCDITGQQQHSIPLPGGPCRIAVVDNNPVAVTLHTTTVVIVDVRQRQVIQRIDVKVGCYGIMYRDNQLFVGCVDRTIKVMNMSGEVTRTIPMGVTPMYICGGEAGRICYTDYGKLYCIDTVGNTLFTFTDPNMSVPWGITTDDEGHVLVICYGSDNVLRISPDGKQSQVIITQIPSRSYICYNSLSKSVVIGRDDNVYVYKKV